MRLFRYGIFIACVFLGCQGGDFSGGSDSATERANKPKCDPSKDPTCNPNNDPLTKQPDSIVVDDSGQIISPNLTQCAELPVAGKLSDGQCGANSVVVIVDDGSNGGMTCCPIGSNVLSQKPGETNITRAQCGENEIATGVSRPNFYCSKINTDSYVLGATTQSILLNSQTSITPQERAIAISYDQFDACVCRVPSVIIGPHSQSNNVCDERCAVVKRK